MSNRGRHTKNQRKYKDTWLTDVLTDAELDLIFERASEQGNCPTLKLIENIPTSIRIFTWDNTSEGWGFWDKVFNKVRIYKRNHELM